MNHRPRRHYPAAAFLIGLLLAAGPAAPLFAADTVRGEFVPETDLRDLRKDGDKVPAGVAWFGSLGVSHIDAEDGSKLWLTPFTLDAELSRDTFVRIEGDGYGHVDLGGVKTQGFNNLTLIASQVVYRDEASRVRLSLGATAPGSSGIGSRGAKQRIAASYSRQLSRSWSVLVSGRLNRRNQDPLPGASRIEQFGRLQTSYALDDPNASRLLQRAVVVQLQRDYRHGAGGSTQATASYEFPLGAKLGGSIGYTRGLSPGLRDNTVAFDLLFAF